MKIVPTQKTAIFAGAWSAFGFVPFEHWLENAHMPSFGRNVLWLCALLVFLLIPAFYFVIGWENGPFTRTWFMDPEQRARYFVIAKRMLCWFMGAAIFGAVWSGLLMLLVNPP